jgi:hypothetical protein
MGVVAALWLAAQSAPAMEGTVFRFSAFDVDRSETRASTNAAGQVTATIIRKTERWAEVIFSLKGSGRKLVEGLAPNFVAEFADGHKRAAYQLRVRGADMEWLHLGRTYTGTVCFGICDFPVSSMYIGTAP